MSPGILTKKNPGKKILNIGKRVYYTFEYTIEVASLKIL